MWSDRNGHGSRVTVEPEPFRYRQVRTGDAANAADFPDEANADPMVRLAEAQRQAFEQGRQQGEAQARSAVQAELVAERDALRRAIGKFKEDQAGYFARIESDVVHLALAIAKKILHREAQMDPLLLTGMVHVALEKLDAGTRVRMRTHPSDIQLWTEYFAQQPALAAQIELAGDPALRRGECVLETESGRTQLSLDGQLQEIEQGFLDLLDQRPAVG